MQNLLGLFSLINYLTVIAKTFLPIFQIQAKTDSQNMELVIFVEIKTEAFEKEFNNLEYLDIGVLSMSNNIGSQLYLRINKVSTYNNLFSLVKEVTILISIYMIMWLLKIPMYLAWLNGTYSDKMFLINSCYILKCINIWGAWVVQITCVFGLNRFYYRSYLLVIISTLDQALTSSQVL